MPPFKHLFRIKDIKKIEDILVKKGWTLVDLQKRAEISMGSISTYLNPAKRQEMGMKNAYSLAKALDIPTPQEDAVIFFEYFELANKHHHDSIEKSK